MKAAAFAVALGLTAICALAASAQDAPPAPAPAEAAPPPSDAPVVDMTRFCRRGDVRHQQRFYPYNAIVHHIQGQAIIDCAMGDDGMPQACQVVDEQPQGAGFGDASLRIACRIAPAQPSADSQDDNTHRYTRDGQHRIRRTINWRIGA